MGKYVIDTNIISNVITSLADKIKSVSNFIRHRRNKNIIITDYEIWNDILRNLLFKYDVASLSARIVLEKCSKEQCYAPEAVYHELIDGGLKLYADAFMGNSLDDRIAAWQKLLARAAGRTANIRKLAEYLAHYGPRIQIVKYLEIDKDILFKASRLAESFGLNKRHKNKEKDADHALVALAKQLGAVLVTADRGVKKLAESLDVETIYIPELVHTLHKILYSKIGGIKIIAEEE